MQAMNQKYDSQIKDLRQRQIHAELCQQENRDSKTLQTSIQYEISAILNGEIENEVFCKTMLESLIVFQDHMELRLNFLPQVFHFH